MSSDSEGEGKGTSRKKKLRKKRQESKVVDRNDDSLCDDEAEMDEVQTTMTKAVAKPLLLVKRLGTYYITLHRTLILF